jgi:CTP:molybdopterin cytidylyltransferase MocA
MQGRDKLLEDVGGEPLLARQLRISAECGVPVLVALPRADDSRWRVASAPGARIVAVDAAPPGMGASIATLAAEAEAAGADALLLLLADMPEVEVDDLRALLSAVAKAPAGTVVRAASASGRAGHPVVFPRELFSQPRRLTGDTGAREVIAAAGHVQLVRLPGQHALTDLDTPEAWEAWRRKRG